MKSNDYWIQRQEAKYLDAERELGKFYTELIKSFQKAKKDVHSVVNDFYIRYANNNELTYDAAMMELSFKELKNLKDELNIFKKMAIESIGEFNLELENMSMKARITRYQALETQIDAILTNLYSIDYKAYGNEKFIDIYVDQYYKTIFNIEQFRGFHQEFAQVNMRAVEELINYPFSGVAYSDRLWKQKDHMLEKLKESIMNMIIKGTNPAELSEEFAKIFDRKQYEAYRLLQMEGAFIIEQATIKGYEEDGIVEYKILATLDLKTSPICREQDGKVYKTKEAVTGVNLPPFHWYCRTTTIPFFEYDEDSKRIARDPISDKNYTVLADMKYDDWYDKYIKNNTEAVIEEKKWNNRNADKKQYEKYKGVLGKEAPKSFAEFQEVKYNNSKEWELLKDYKNSRESNMISAFSTFEDYKKYKEIIDKELVGLVTKNGIEIKGQTKHFIERVLGTNEDPKTKRARAGVSIEDIKNALLNPNIIRSKNDSIKFLTDECDVSINPKTGILIQTNP